MKPKPTEIEAFAIRRATLADKDKVRYRVYTSPTEFVAVIAESALMAMKLTGIGKPHKIVRDMPTQGVAIEAERIAKVEEAAIERVLFATQQKEGGERIVVNDLPVLTEDIKQTQFKPMHLSDLTPGGTTNARILPPELLTEIIEEHLRGHQPPAAAPAPKPAPAPIMAPEPEPEQPTPPPAPVPDPHEQLSPEARLLAVADEVLPPSSSASAQPAASADTGLSPDEVDKLLNE